MEINSILSFPSFSTTQNIMQIIIPVDSGDKPKRSPPSRFAARMRARESEKTSELKTEQSQVVESTSSTLYHSKLIV